MLVIGVVLVAGVKLDRGGGRDDGRDEDPPASGNGQEKVGVESFGYADRRDPARRPDEFLEIDRRFIDDRCELDFAREQCAPFRIGIANANVPNMLGQISTAMANAGLNIHNMVNKSRGDMAYTLVDVDSAVKPELLDALRGIDGVLSVRYLPSA